MKYNNLYAYFQLAATETKGLGSDFLQLIQQASIHQNYTGKPFLCLAAALKTQSSSKSLLFYEYLFNIPFLIGKREVY